MGNLLNGCRWGVLALVLLISTGAQAENCSNGVCTEPATSNAAGTLSVQGTYPIIASNIVTKCDAFGRGGYPNCSSIGQPDYFRASDNKAMCGSLQMGACGFTARPNAVICPTGYQAAANNLSCVNTALTYTCPSTGGWTLSGQTCTRPACEAGKERLADGRCVKDCTGKLGQSPPSPSYEFTNDGGSPSVGGCLVKCNTWTRAGGGTSLIPSTMSASGCTYTGASDISDNQTDGVGFTPKPAEPKTPNDCLGAGMGYISGSTGTTCVASEKAPEGQKPAAVEEKKQAESGSAGTDGKPDPNAADYKKVDTETKTEGGKTTTKKTETINSTPGVEGGETTCPSGYTRSTDGLKCTKVTSTTQETKDFCQENPQASACKNQKDSSFNGTCEAGFTCEGDAAQCAAAKASWELKCSMEKGDGTSDSGKGLIDGNDPLEGTLPNQVSAETFNFATLGYVDTAGSCPPDINFAVMGRSVSLSMAEACTVGTWLGRIGVALSLLMGAMLIVGGIRN